MPRRFGRLPFLTRRSTSPDRGASELPAMAARSVDPDAAPVGPPVLLPATIVRQLLFDATELTPVWARPRPVPEAAAVPAEPAPIAARKRARTASTGGAAKAGADGTTPRRTRRSTRAQKGDS